jgi:hypothetical protein
MIVSMDNMIISVDIKITSRVAMTPFMEKKVMFVDTRTKLKVTKIP